MDQTVEEPLPPGFVLEQPQAAAPVAEEPLPEGFVLEEPEEEPLPPGFQLEEDKYGTTGQQVLTGVEHAAKGALGPLATLAEQKLSDWGVEGLTNEDILSREKINPGISTATELGGNVAAMALLPEVKGVAMLGKVGSAAINLAIKSGLIQAGDETSKAMLGVGNPSDAVAANIAKAGGIGLLTGGVFGAGNSAATKLIGKTDLGSKMKSFVAGFGHAATVPNSTILSLSESALTNAEKAGLENAGFKMGQKTFGSVSGKTASLAAKIGAGVIGHKVGDTTGMMVFPYLEAMIEPYIGKAATKVVGPSLMKAAASGNLDKLAQIVNYATEVAKGEKMMNKAVEGLFSAGAYDLYGSAASEKDREKLRENIDNGGLDTQILDEHQDQNSAQGFAEGGQVPHTQNNLENMYPDHNMLFSAAKMRVSNYLKSKKPMGLNSMRAFDSEHKDIEQEHKYNRLLDLANQPLSIMKHIKKGNLLPQHVDAIKSMYPEMHEVLSKKIMEQIGDKVHNKEKPPYAVRQALSLFLGQDLDSSMSPSNIQAAQAVFAQQKQQSPAANSMSGLKTVGQDTMTAEQSREKRLNKH